MRTYDDYVESRQEMPDIAKAEDALSSNICFWLDMELLSPCNSSSRLKRSYSGVIFSFLMAVPPETKML